MTKSAQNTKVEVNNKNVNISAQDWLMIVEDQKLTTVSSQIRYLASVGYSTEENKYGKIARFLDKRIQHVRNILTQPLVKK